VVVYIAGADSEIAWADAVRRLIADGVIAGPEDARGLTTGEVLWADVEELRADDAERDAADLVVHAWHRA